MDQKACRDRGKVDHKLTNRYSFTLIWVHRDVASNVPENESETLYPLQPWAEDVDPLIKVEQLVSIVHEPSRTLWPIVLPKVWSV